MVAGFLLVVLDLRLSGFDLLLDPLGWVVVVRSLGRLARLDSGFSRPRSVAVLAGVLSVADVVRPVVEGRDVPPQGWLGLLLEGYGLAIALVLVLLAFALRDRAGAVHEPASARRFHGFAMVLAVLAVLSCVLGALVLLVDPPLLPVLALVVVAVADFLVTIWFVVVVARHRRVPWLQDAVAEPLDAGR